MTLDLPLSGRRCLHIEADCAGGAQWSQEEHGEAAGHGALQHLKEDKCSANRVSLFIRPSCFRTGEQTRATLIAINLYCSDDDGQILETP